MLVSGGFVMKPESTGKWPRPCWRKLEVLYSGVEVIGSPFSSFNLANHDTCIGHKMLLYEGKRQLHGTIVQVMNFLKTLIVKILNEREEAPGAPFICSSQKNIDQPMIDKATCDQLLF